MSKQKIIIVGGGAAGFFAAITCANKNPNLQVIILERGKNVLSKVKISGGGRCNVTHACFEPRALTKFYPRGEKALLGPFHTFCTGDTMAWYDERGVETKIEDDGRVFPTSDDSQTIIDCLVGSAKKAGVLIKTNTRVTDFQYNEATEEWVVETPLESYRASKLMLATGSTPQIWKLLGKLGHKIIEPVPSLFTFNIKDERLKDLPGLSVPRAELKVQSTKLKSDGALLITHWGLSGPAILKLSAWGARILNEKDYQFGIQVNWLGHSNQQQIVEELRELKMEQSQRLVIKYPQFDLPRRLWQKLVSAANIEEHRKWADTSKKQLHKLAHELVQGEYTVKGKSTFKDEFVTAGGIDLKEVDFKRFASKKFPKLFFAGEVLDIDAITGGFNFQAAWTGGFIVGNAMAENE